MCEKGQKLHMGVESVFKIKSYLSPVENITSCSGRTNRAHFCIFGFFEQGQNFQIWIGLRKIAHIFLIENSLSRSEYFLIWLSSNKIECIFCLESQKVHKLSENVWSYQITVETKGVRKISVNFRQTFNLEDCESTMIIINGKINWIYMFSDGFWL